MGTPVGLGSLKEVASGMGWEGLGSLLVRWIPSVDLIQLRRAALAKRQALLWCVTHTDSCNAHSNL